MTPSRPEPASPRHGAILLAGGRSSRMGRPKWSLPFGDQLLVDRVVDVLLHTSPTRVVVVGSADDPPTVEAREGVELLVDPTPFPGPLAALLHGLTTFGDVEIVFVAAVDLPFLTSRFVAAILDQLRCSPGSDAVVPFLEQAHPLCAAYRTEIVPRLRSLIEPGVDRRMMDLLNRIETRYLSADNMRRFDPELRALVNVNSPDDYDDAIRLEEPRS